MCDRITGREGVASARWIENAGGCWAENLNQRFHVDSDWKHVFGKGVFIAVPRDACHRTPLTFENRLGDAYSLIPWGPVALWGPTETISGDPESGYVADSADVRLLLDEINRHVVRLVEPDDIVALRCGVRPLAMRKSYDSDQYTLNISRRHIVERQSRVPWISVYGGKLSGGTALGREVADAIGRVLPRPGALATASWPAPPTGTERFPGLVEPVLSSRDALQNECCWTLEDYLRRRTNIAQWVPRHGLGRVGEHTPRLAELAAIFPGVDGIGGAAALSAYCERVEREFDAVLAAV